MVLKCIDWSWLNSADLRCPSAKLTGSYLFKGNRE